MADDNISLLTEAYNRGILPPDQSAAYEEAVKRGLLGSTPTPTSSPSPAAVSFPNDAPGTTYGNVLPFATNDKTGEISLAAPEAIRAPLRGLQSLYEKAKTGFAPQSSDVDQKVPTPDELAAITSLARPAVRVGPPGVRGPAPTPEITPERAALAKEATEDFKIPLTAPQIGTSKGAKFVADTLPGGEAQQAATKEAFGRAVSNTMGEDSPVITQTVMDTAKRRIGGVMNRIEDSTPVNLGDPATVADFSKIESNANKTLTPAEYSVLKKQMDNVFEHIEPGDTISGETYGNLLHKGGALDAAIASDNANISRYASQIKDTLQDALERSMQAKAPSSERAIELENLLAQGKARLENIVQGATNKEMVRDFSSPSGYKFVEVDPKAIAAQNAKYEAELYGAQRDLEAYRQARSQYKNMKTIEPLVNKAPDGNISPALLNAQVTKQFPNRAYDASGKNPLDRLAKIGQAFLKEPNTSGSAERGATLAAIGKVSGALAGVGGAAAIGALPQAAIAGGAAYGIGRGAGAFLRRPGAANALIQRGLNPLEGRMNYGVQSGAPVALGGQVPANALNYGSQPVNSLAFARDRARK